MPQPDAPHVVPVLIARCTCSSRELGSSSPEELPHCVAAQLRRGFLGSQAGAALCKANTIGISDNTIGFFRFPSAHRTANSLPLSIQTEAERI